ncbi:MULTISPECIES: hypothetical protein [unclassified Pseudoalteromonas]|nr:hypothetical protein [Pseudoalteromonas sp. S2755]
MSPTKTKKNVFRNLNTFESKRVVGGSHGGTVDDPKLKSDGSNGG